MSTVTPITTFKFSQNSVTNVLSLSQHSNLQNISVSTDDAVYLLRTTPHGLEIISSLNISGVKSKLVEVNDDTVFGIDDQGNSFVIDWRLGTTISEVKIPTPALTKEVEETGPQWVYGFDKNTNRVAYGFGNFFNVGDIRYINPSKDVLFEEMHSECIRELTFINNGEILISSGADGLLQFFDMKSFSSKIDPDELLLDVINLEDAGVASFYKENNNVFAVGDDQKLRLYDLETYLLIANPLHASDFSGAYFIDLLPNRHVAIGNVYGDAFIASLTGVEDNQLLYQGVAILQGHKDIIKNISWNGNINNNIFTSDDSGVVCLWNVQEHTRNELLNENSISRHNPY